MIFVQAYTPPRVSFAEAPLTYVAAGLCIAAFLAASLRLHLLLWKSRKYRIDLRPRDSIYSGRSWIWQENVLTTRNYRPGTGKAIVRGMLVCMAVQVLAGFAAFFILFLGIL